MDNHKIYNNYNILFCGRIIYFNQIKTKNDRILTWVKSGNTNSISNIQIHEEK